MTPTRIRTLAVIALATVLLGWFIVAMVDALAQRLLPVPWSAAVALALMAFALLVWALLARPRLLRKPGRPPLPPLTAARTAALAMAASRTGAGVGGFYAGVALGLLPSWDTPAGQDYVLAAAGAAAASAVLAVVGLWLESLCRLPGGDEDGEGAPGNGSAQQGPASGEAARNAA
jgi:hypothetical protein